MNIVKSAVGILFLLGTGITVVSADELSAVPTTDANKWQYNLFNPTPRALMREMSTDRPDKTESAYTVDAGHFQFEADLVSFSIDRWNADGERGFGVNVANVNLKAGLYNNVDLQLVVENYVYEQVRSDGVTARKSGFGDLATRLKVNLWGNDGGRTALAVMPFVKFPTNTGGLGNKQVEGGIILPLAVELPCGWRMGVMTEFDIVYREHGGYGPDFVNSITFSHDIIGNLAGYVEFFSQLTEDDLIITLDAGLTYALTEDIQLDCGCNFGITEAAEDFNPFVGISMRF
ncbi:MAG TPA: transporter [Terrimicrobiaceae bacterium]